MPRQYGSPYLTSDQMKKLPTKRCLIFQITGTILIGLDLIGIKSGSQLSGTLKESSTPENT